MVSVVDLHASLHTLAVVVPPAWGDAPAGVVTERSVPSDWGVSTYETVKSTSLTLLRNPRRITSIDMQQNDMAIPILPSRSLSDTLVFYRRLGFEGEIHAHGDYAILRRGTVELHFFTHRELNPAESSAGCYIRVVDVESIYRAFSVADLPRRGIPRQDALELKPWRMKEFAVVDPDGNLIRIGQTVG